MTTLIRKLFQGFDASSLSIETDYLTLSVDNVQGIAHLVGCGVKLEERQCRDLSSKLVKTVESIQKLVSHSGAVTGPFRGALKNLYRISEKAKLLVNHCSDIDWCRAAVFQIHNEETFRQILLEVGLCYNVIYEQAKDVMRDLDWRLLQVEDLRQLSTFLPASESDVCADQQSLEKNLQHLVSTSDDPNQCLARYLLGRLKCISKECINEDFSMPDAVLWVDETEPQETWKLQRVIGSGSGASCVCSYKWLGIPCARKEFHCKVADGIFRREVAILARLNHPNIVKFFCCSIGPEKGECFIAMELMDMGLDDLIESRRNAGQVFSILIALDIIVQIARGMWYLHDLKIAHRDLKPQNVVVSEIPSPHLKDNFSVKLVDFGMSKTKVQISKSNTVSMPGVGTTTYRAPEVFAQAHQGDKRKVNWFQADAYSFAVTCGALLSLKEPYQGVPKCDLYGELLSGRRPELPRECPKDLAALLIECWDANPQSRPNFAEICTRLEKCKFLDILRRQSIAKSGSLERIMSYKYIESVLKKQALVQPQRATTISSDSDQCEDNIILAETYTTVGFTEESSRSNYNHSEDRQITWERKKKVGLWSRTKYNFKRFMFKALRAKEEPFLFSSGHPGEARVVFKAVGNSFQLAGKKDLELVNKGQLKCFTLLELQQASDNFNNHIASGGFGSLYRGRLADGRLVAIKCLYKDSTWRDYRIKAEVERISLAKHQNILQLQGYCITPTKCLLVYPYMSNGSLTSCLIGYVHGPLDFHTRRRIALGIAHGLAYMHDHCDPKIICENLKPSNILLNENLEPLIAGDFGLAKLMANEDSDGGVRGTIGYMAPEYLAHCRCSEETVVFAYGMSLLELITGEPPRSLAQLAHDDHMTLLDWVNSMMSEGKLDRLVDPALEDTYDKTKVEKLLKVAMLCGKASPKDRPKMSEVVCMLEEEDT